MRRHDIIESNGNLQVSGKQGTYYLKIKEDLGADYMMSLTRDYMADYMISLTRDYMNGKMFSHKKNV